MADAKAQAIVDATLALRRSHPDVPALDVLDLVMQDHCGSDPDFDAVRPPDCLELPSPFAQMLREAFAPGLEVVETTGTSAEDLARRDAFAGRWISVIDRFARRYRLWEPR